ncbi:GPI anchored serine-threonine rich family protein [Roseivirga pacifica]|uniref:GPI anchored serine-threonine rich family protein n=1 Tax=Roseivirga pacifica TaxID=1267423 RepID=UPI00209430C4|nr:GPI anchored serine-threonine rich family protein [Roseivirga pacifica]MCO6359612.1 hypothetical protein [Roseivirga pacifica]MCO6366982.1 hypothetical protein [Roseivirga pacifica]MCO6370486.1 hypothetical protein [Roseivirga pacifica]MCO6374639.1 hypothetical protein [Roseivirga pacifica]MCO6379897.1 hypothetical protein [Roseivirga pacifica]
MKKQYIFFALTLIISSCSLTPEINNEDNLIIPSDKSCACYSSISISSSTGDRFLPGETIDLDWSSVGGTSISFDLRLLKNGQTVMTIAENVSNQSVSGTYQWVVPGGLDGGDDYAIELYDSYNPPTTTSNFSISEVYVWNFDGSDNPKFDNITYGNATAEAYTGSYSMKFMDGTFNSRTHSLGSIDSGVQLVFSASFYNTLITNTNRSSVAIDVIIDQTTIATIRHRFGNDWGQSYYTLTTPSSGTLKLKLYDYYGMQIGYLDNIRMEKY